jgi:2,4-diaminopentanoate dehydrogenase
MTIRVMQVGLGPIGMAVVQQVVTRTGFRLVGAVDVAPDWIGRDVGHLLDRDRALGVLVSDRIDTVVKDSTPDIAVVCTSSSLEVALPLFEEILERGTPIVTTTEEAAYPDACNRAHARRLDEMARKSGVAVLSTGVNPGFMMDALPIALTAVCERVDRIEVHRVQDARVRRLPFQQKIGTGLALDDFQQRVARGAIRHVGFAESIQMIADSLGWPLERVTDQVSPRIAEHAVASEWFSVPAGAVCGIVQDGVGYVTGEPRITLRLEAYLGAEAPYDSVLIEGVPRIHSRIEGGVHGDIATAAIVVNSMPAVIAAAPGLHTMRDMRLPSFYSGMSSSRQTR